MSDIKMSDWFELPVRRHYSVIVESDENQRSDTEALDAAVLAINSHDKLTARIAELEALIKEADEYLNTNSMTSIGSGSILHTKFKQELKDNS